VDAPDEKILPASDPIKPARYLQEEFVDRTAVQPAPEPVRPAEIRQEPTTISGPSFLGLTTNNESDEASYLLQDDQPRRGGWVIFALIAIAVFAGIGWLEWDSIKSGKLNIPYFKRSNTDAAATPAPAPAQPTGDQTASTSTAPPTDATPTKPAGDTDDKLITGDNNAATDKNATTADSTKPSTPSAAPETTKADGSKTQPTPTAEATENDKTPAATAPTTPPAKNKPSARAAAAVEKTEDPQQNKMLVLGEKFLYGRGVPQNCNQALIYFRAAADQANAPAMSHLGAMYASGNCVSINRATAYSWFARAQNADPGNSWREKNMNMLWRDMTPQERASVSR